jgi:diadenosine tetraphosphatase ApaH/serine/threonine PP2A family protein phosphatase
MRPRVLAAMGGAYGNLHALAACLEDATQRGAQRRAFLGDAIGCCGHSDAIVAMIVAGFDICVAGNHEHQAVARAETCGCGYSSPDDEEISCEAFQLATASLSDVSRERLASWPSSQVVDLEGGRVLLCHGSPGHTSEFLYEVELDDLRLEAWLDSFDVRGFVCTHSGLPFVRMLRGGRFAVNCGVVGKPDHDGDPAVHYALIELSEAAPSVEIRRVSYDHEAWARQMEAARIAPVFVEPIRTGIWTTGVASLPVGERHRHLRAGRSRSSWRPELLDAAQWSASLERLHALGLVTSSEVAELEALLDPAFPWFSAVHRCDSVHAHIKVEDVDRLPLDRIGGRLESARPGYVKLCQPGGLNFIFSSIPIAEEDQLADHPRPTRPFVDHFGVDLRREQGIVRAVFEDTPEIARRAGWATKSQGGPGRAVFCCHAQVARKYWVYPPVEASRWTRPIELAFGPLVIGERMTGCDLRPIDPKHPAAAELAACVPSTNH